MTISVSDLESGLELQDRLNEALEGREADSLEDRVSSLSELGVVGFTSPTWDKHLQEIKNIADNDENWLSIEVLGKTTVRVLLIRYDNCTQSLYKYFKAHFEKLSEEELIENECWEDIKTYNWQYHSIAKEKFGAEETARKGKSVGQPIISREQRLQILRERAVQNSRT
jgi:hypothetical protein